MRISVQWWVGMALVLGATAGADSASVELSPALPIVLTNAAQVHALPAELAAQNLPVRLHGVVTHYHPQLSEGLCFQDETDGVYVSLTDFRPGVRRGDRVMIEGVTGAGDYAPVVLLRRLQNLGRGELPEPEKVTAAALATGRYDSRRVEVRGIVRSAAPAQRTKTVGAHLAMELRSDGNDLLVRVTEYQPANTNWVDAEVIICGVAAGVFSWQRQLLSPIVVAATHADVEVVRPAQPVDSLPVITIRSLFNYSPEGFPQHRVRLRGQLLGRQAGKWLAVRDASSGLFVESPDGAELQPGDEVELIGFPEMREQTLWLVKPILRQIGRAAAPQVVASSVTNALRHPCELHRLKGVLTQPPRPGEGSWVLSLRDGEWEFEAWLPATAGTYPDAWRENARLAVTGITEPFFLPSHRPTMFPFPRGLRLHARTLADVQVLRGAPWWTSPRLTRTVLVTLAGALVLLGLTSLTAVHLARKNAALREAREQLRAARDELARRYTVRTGEWQEELAARHAAEADFALLTAERTRLARELHDTLEQSLASAALHLDAANGFFRERPAESERLLEAATRQLRQSQLEVRRSVWNLRALALEQATLPDALRQLGKALADTHGPVIEVRCEGQPQHIPPGDASHLFRIAQEGVTNALKHAGAQKIEIVLAFTPEGVQLQVNDDGCGFDPAAVSLDGHFGLRGLKERAGALGAELTLESQPGAGTRLRLDVPAARLKEA
ncbi:MAG: sensor histidine kinase [Verrucomicrobia bacterium]|nr:sensor histidine kinase [Verrucomicrobiota bacterium]